MHRQNNGIVITSSKAASLIEPPISTALHATATSLKLGCLEENSDFDRSDPLPGNG
jgi:hypothetical protein